jgi:hypothetical protein
LERGDALKRQPPAVGAPLERRAACLRAQSPYRRLRRVAVLEQSDRNKRQKGGRSRLYEKTVGTRERERSLPASLSFLWSQ